MPKSLNLYPPILLASLASATNFLPGVGYLRELNSNLWLAYLLFHILAAAGCVIGFARLRTQGRFAVLLIQCVLLCGYLAPLSVFYKHVPAPEDGLDARRVRLLFVSECQPECLAELGDYIQDNSVDIVGFASSKKFSLPADIRGLKKTAAGEGEDGWMAALYSSLGEASEAQAFFGEDIKPTLFAKFSLPGEPLAVALARTEFPFKKGSFIANELVLRRLSSKLRQLGDPALVFTGGGISPFSAQLRKFQKGAYLTNALEGRGLQGTFPSDAAVPGLNLDQLFYRGAISISELKLIKIKGAPNLAVLAEAGMLKPSPLS